ncbi:MAG: hypothetical protein AAFX99_08610 [Myxococcota bacterium]
MALTPTTNPQHILLFVAALALLFALVAAAPNLFGLHSSAEQYPENPPPPCSDIYTPNTKEPDLGPKSDDETRTPHLSDVDPSSTLNVETPAPVPLPHIEAPNPS